MITKTRKKKGGVITIVVLTTIFLAISLIASSAFCATYWISPTGAAANLVACSGETPLSGTPACSYDKANGSGVKAGDTVYYRAGTYKVTAGSAINPYNTGTAGNVITFSSYNNENVQFISTGVNTMAVNLDSEYGTVRSYIKITGLKFANFLQHLWIRKGGYNEVSYCTFLGYPTTATSSSDLAWSASYIYRQAQYNWIHHNTFGEYGWCEPYGTDYGVVFQVGLETSTTDYTKYNLIEYNTMYHGGHHVASFNGTNNVYRNNYIRNDPWCSGDTYSTRTLFQTGAPGDGQYNLAEANRIGYGGPKNKNEIGGAGGTIAGAYNIWRQNEYVNIYTDAMYVTKYAGQSDVKYNKVYNNTFWHGGYGDAQKDTANWEDRYTHPIVVEEGATGGGVYKNTFKNNLFYQNNDLLGTNYSIISRYYSSGWHTLIPIFQDISNNWFDNAGDPMFVDITGTPDPTNGAQWDFNLQSNSGAINAGTYLTTVSSVKSDTAFSVPNMDAGYFFDGWGISSGIPNAKIGADYICLTPGTSVNYDHCVQISAIDYTNNIVNTVIPHGANAGWYVWLYKNSLGTQVLYGSAPDMGAYEYGMEPSTQEPAPTTSVPPTIAVSPTIKDFGTLPINTSSPAQRFTVTTTGGNLNVDAISMTGTDATQFAIQNDSCTGKIIAPEIGSCTFDVKFSPLSVGTKAANVAIVDNDSNTSKLIAVSGTGASQIPAISFSPTSLSFSNVLSGTLSSPQTINVSNNSANFVTISSISLSGTYANQFSIPAATDYCTGETVAASGNCSFQVIFAPTSGGEKTANVNLTSLYYSSPATLPLYGSAVVYQSPVPRIKISKKK